MIKAILIDWGRTLHDPKTDGIYPGVAEVLEALMIKYPLAIVSLAKSSAIAKMRWNLLRSLGLDKYFKLVIFGIAKNRNKDLLYRSAVRQLSIDPPSAVVIDDRYEKGIRWALQNGAHGIWLRHDWINTELGHQAQTILEVTDWNQVADAIELLELEEDKSGWREKSRS